MVRKAKEYRMVSVYLTPKLYKELEKEARESDTPLSSLIKQKIVEANRRRKNEN